MKCPVDLGSQDVLTKGVQKSIIKEYSSKHGATELHEVIERRLSTWLHGPEPQQWPFELNELAFGLINMWKRAAAELPHHIVAASIKLVHNAWITTGRMGMPKECRFGCGLQDGDCVRHLAFCPVFATSCKGYFPNGFNSWPLGRRIPPPPVCRC